MSSGPSSSSSSGATNGSTKSNGSSSSNMLGKKSAYLAIWDLDGEEVTEWIESVPGLFQVNSNDDKAVKGSQQGTYQSAHFLCMYF
jgi:hypothetical protein